MCIRDSSIVYLRVYLLGIIASFLYNIGSAVLRAVGDTRRPLYFLIAACLLNILPDLALVLGPVSYTHLDVYKRQSPCRSA